ncbi:pentatricopeptide repeat-containing protein At1g08070, chloroplastic-like [Bidens hawaiensis]|uniref:pentatricopeptide repeat-containing protein At1g08070, chloroplastic-like n=1 Tax=Bidens hawaiensis TaxID=980011 RepID=UPI00404B4A9A
MRPVVRMLSQLHQPDKTTYTYNTLIKSHLSNSNPLPETAFEIFVKMKRNGIRRDNYTYPIVLKACKMIRGLWEGKQVHAEVVKYGFFNSDVFVINGLIGMYCKCRQMRCSRAVFDWFDDKDLVSWNLMVSGYVECGDMVEAHKVFDEMPQRDVVSWSVMIDGYGKRKGDVTRARMLFDEMPKRDLVSWNTMLDSYTKVGDMVAARELFYVMEHKSLISWSIIINGYTHHHNPVEALNVFNQMLSRNIKPDKFCIVSAISSCAQLGALDQGRWIHMYVKKNKIACDIVVNTALIDMYMKCGSIEEGRAVFNSMSEKNVVTWNVMISGLGVNGFGNEALTCFGQLERERIEVDDLIYVSVLSACSHSGFVAKGVEIFRRIRNPKVEHYGCLIDLLVRGGKLDQTLSFIGSMPMEPNKDLWGSLLLECRVQKNVGFGEFVVNKIKEIGGDDSGVYVLMSNIYADNGMWDEVMKMRAVLLEKGVVKEGGKSVIEAVDGGVVEFGCGKSNRLVINDDMEHALWSLSKMMDLDFG